MVRRFVDVIVVGPKEIPRVLRTVTGAMRKIRGMAREFQSSIDDLAREAELDDLLARAHGNSGQSGSHPLARRRAR